MIIENKFIINGEENILGDFKLSKIELSIKIVIVKDNDNYCGGIIYIFLSIK